LILYCHCEVVHFTIDILHDLIIGKQLVTEFCIDPQLISDNISKKGLILIEILPITALLAVAEREIGLIPS
jgi:hypothetical protein